nr:MAG TPA: hypothetical protein [Caudoviricetes sp.]
MCKTSLYKGLYRKSYTHNLWNHSRKPPPELEFCFITLKR